MNVLLSQRAISALATAPLPVQKAFIKQIHFLVRELRYTASEFTTHSVAASPLPLSPIVKPIDMSMAAIAEADYFAIPLEPSRIPCDLAPKPHWNLVDVLGEPPFAGSELNLERQKDYPRSLDL